MATDVFEGTFAFKKTILGAVLFAILSSQVPAQQEASSSGSIHQSCSEEREKALVLSSGIAGMLEWSEDGDPPKNLRLLLQPTALTAGQGHIFKAKSMDLPCSLEGERFYCDAPEGEFDAKLMADGIAPRYLWGLDLQPEGTVQVEPWTLKSGASVSGWVVLKDPGGSEQEEGDQVTPKVILERQASGWQSPAEKRRMGMRRLEASVDERGFFQLIGAEPGGFRLRVVHEGFVPQVRHDLKVVAGQELALRDPLELHPPVEVEVVLTPPTQPDGMPWRLQLFTLVPDTTVLQDVISAEVPVQGTWQGKVEASGNHKLVVLDEKEQTWEERWLDVQPGLRPTFIEIPLVEVKGRIQLGNEPLAARLVFGSTQGVRQVTMNSDEDGDFEGYLPHEGLWPVDLVATEGPSLNQALSEVEVRRRPGQLVAKLDIELPATVLRGEVVRKGEPIPDARLVVLRQEEEKQQREGVGMTDANGVFELQGLNPGVLWVHAYRGKASSPWTRIDLSEDLEVTTVRLELEDKIELSGVVLSPDGEVPGADVRAIPAGADRGVGLIAQDRTRFDGSFSLELAPSTTAVDLMVTAPGYARQLLHLPLRINGSGQAMVHVDAESGTLVFQAPEISNDSGQRQITSSSTLHYNGTALPLSYLYQMSSQLRHLGVHQGRLSLLTMPLGEYQLCDAEGQICQSGFLALEGELVLQDPPRASTDP